MTDLKTIVHQLEADRDFIYLFISLLHRTSQRKAIRVS